MKWGCARGCHLSFGALLWTVLMICRTSSAITSASLLDQDFAPASWDTISLLGEGVPYSAQTVTPVMSGGLTRAVVYFERVSSYTGLWDVSIRPVDSSGYPTATILALRTLTAVEVPLTTVVNGYTTVDFPSPAHVTAGQPFAIVVNPNPPVYGAGLMKGSWMGNSTSTPYQYAGGTTSVSYDGVSFSDPYGAKYDHRFQTWVDPLMTPEPAATGLLCAITFGGIARRQRRA